MSRKRDEKIVKWLRTGEVGEPKTTEELLQIAGRLLDKACSHEICGGEVVFQTADGKWKVLTVEARIGDINPSYLAELQAEEEEA